MHNAYARFSPELFFDTVNAYFRTAALKAAIELDLFSAVGEVGITSDALAQACKCSPRGIRILSNYLVYIGLLCQSGDRYFMTRDMIAVLDKKSPGYLGGTIDFLLSPEVTGAFADLTRVVRTGEMTCSNNGALAPEHPQWVKFARSMTPMMTLPSFLLADLVDGSRQPLKVLDVAAGHGLFGIAFAIQNPRAEVTAVDWTNVLTVARENAQAAGVIDRFTFLPGDAFAVDFGEGYDIVLFANFLHHFGKSKCEEIIAKAHRSLAINGRVATLEFIANEDRTSPPLAITFSMMMLGTTPDGEVYSYSDLQQMFANVGFARSEFHDLHPAIEKVVISYK
jgi:2-polyprenyl-3-methyl-5-hydroxy-6-metoxy-1,4-benzoquinol methylase